MSVRGISMNSHAPEGNQARGCDICGKAIREDEALCDDCIVYMMLYEAAREQEPS